MIKREGPLAAFGTFPITPPSGLGLRLTGEARRWSEKRGNNQSENVGLPRDGEERFPITPPCRLELMLTGEARRWSEKRGNNQSENAGLPGDGEERSPGKRVFTGGKAR